MERNVEALEGGNGLLAAILENPEVALREVFDRLAVLVDGTHVEQHGVDAALEQRGLGWRLGRRMGGRHEDERGGKGREQARGFHGYILIGPSASSASISARTFAMSAWRSST